MTVKEKRLRQLFQDNSGFASTTEDRFVNLISEFCKNERKMKLSLTDVELDQDAVKHYKDNNVSTRHWVDIVSYKLVWKRCYNHYFNKEK